MDIPVTPDDPLHHCIARALHHPVTSDLQPSLELLREILLDSDVVWEELMVESGVGYGLTQLSVEVQHIQDHLRSV